LTTGQWVLDASDGDLLLYTGMAGAAARMGHRLTFAMRSWQATVDWDGDEPCAVEVIVDLDSLDVLKGVGGAMPLTGPEKTLVRVNALKTLRTRRSPQATFRSSSIERAIGSLRFVGTLDLGGRSSEQVVEVRVVRDGADWCISGEAVVRHTDHGLRQYSMLMGAMKVDDEVRVTLTATYA
jgi:polyisoprenoid-binding protein YceI